MLKYLIENKEWIFSGIGVFLLAGGFSIVRLFLSKKKLNKQSNINQINEPTTLQEESNVPANTLNVTDITVKQIINDIHNAPPFQQDSVSQNYNGLKVQWEGRLWEVKKVDFPHKLKKTVRVIIHPISDNLHYSIIFNVNIDKYPDLKITKRDSLISVEGKIINCSSQGMYVEIEPSNLQFINTH